MNIPHLYKLKDVINFRLDKFAILRDNVCKTLAISEGFAHIVNQPNYNKLFEIAENQAGYFTAYQAKEVGFSWERLSYYTTTGKFTCVRRGIYRRVQLLHALIEQSAEGSEERSLVENIRNHIRSVHSSSPYQPSLPGVEDV